MKSIKSHLIILCFFLVAVTSVRAQSLQKTVDKIMNERYTANKPGAVALIAKDGEVLYRKAFGKANLELGVAMKPEHVLEIGSITKQFTSVSILMLLEQGKLSLDDEITKYLPDYPTHAKTITVHHLLNHTSGIRSYTNMPSFMSRAREDMSPTTLIDVFKNEPMDFDPGEQYAYNNSAYIVLGHIIEVVSGEPYAQFIENHIFKRLGMNNSHYGSHSKIIKNRASGYQPIENGYRNADYLSMTLPYAGGSLMSCVDDMLLWQRAIHKNMLISEKSKQLAFSSGKLNDGSLINYGYGFSVDDLNGTPSIEHGGGIFGYTCYGIYVPSKDLYAIVLTNSNGNNPTDVCIKIAAEALGKPYPTKQGIKISEEKMKQWVGTYKFDDGAIRYITYSNGSLYSQRDGSTNLKLYAVGADQYNFEEGFTSYIFTREKGKKVALFKSRILERKGLESNQKPPSQREIVVLDTEILKKYVGSYQLQPGFEIAISRNGNQIFATATGQDLLEIFAVDETTFIIKEIQAKIVFSTKDDGSAESLTLHQGGQQMEGKKIE